MKNFGRLVALLVLAGGLGFGIWFFWPKAEASDVNQTLNTLQTQIQKKDSEGARRTLAALQMDKLPTPWLKLLKLTYLFGQTFNDWKELETWTEKSVQAGFGGDNRFIPFRIYSHFKNGNSKQALQLADDYKLDSGKFSKLKTLLKLKAEFIPPSITLDVPTQIVDRVLFGKELWAFPEFFQRIYELTGDLGAARNAMVLYLKNERYGSAKEMLDLINPYGNDPYFWAKVYYDLGDLSKALLNVNELNQGSNATMDSLLLQGDILMRQNQWEYAKSVFLKLVNWEAKADKDKPEVRNSSANWRSYYNLALINLLQGETIQSTLSRDDAIPKALHLLWNEALQLIEEAEKDPDTKQHLALLKTFIEFKLSGKTEFPESPLIEAGSRPTSTEEQKLLAENYETQNYFLDRLKYPPAKIIPRLRQLFSRTWTAEFLSVQGRMPNENVAESLVWNYLLNAEPEKALQVLDSCERTAGLMGPSEGSRLKMNLTYWVPFYKGISYGLKKDWVSALRTIDQGPLNIRNFTGSYNRGLVLSVKGAGENNEFASGTFQQAVKAFNEAFNFLPWSEDLSTSILRSKLHTQRAKAKWADPPRMAGPEAEYQTSLAKWKQDIETDLTEAAKFDSQNYEAFFLLKRFKTHEKGPELEDKNDKTKDKRTD